MRGVGLRLGVDDETVAAPTTTRGLRLLGAFGSRTADVDHLRRRRLVVVVDDRLLRPVLRRRGLAVLRLLMRRLVD